MNYITRIVEKEIIDKLSNNGIIFVEGIRGSGKSTTMSNFSKSVLNMQDDKRRDNYILLASAKPSLLLKGDRPRLIDEWQTVPSLFTPIKFFVDKVVKSNQYILTSSMKIKLDDSINDEVNSIPSIKIRPMTLFESGDSNGKISLKNLLDGDINISGFKSNLTYEDIAFLLCRGGFPFSIRVSKEQSLVEIRKYLDELCSCDISKIDGVKRNSSLAREILKSYSTKISTLESNKTLFDDVRNNYSDISNRTIIDYLDIFKRLYVIDEIEAWRPDIRIKRLLEPLIKRT